MGEVGSGSRSIGKGSRGGLLKSLAGRPYKGEFIGGSRSSNPSWWDSGWGTSTGCDEGERVGFSVAGAGRVEERDGGRCCRDSALPMGDLEAESSARDLGVPVVIERARE